MPTADISLAQPYDYELSLKFCSRSKFEIIDQASPGRLERTMVIRSCPIRVVIQFQGSPEGAECFIEWTALDGHLPEEQEVIEAVKRGISSGLDLRPFYDLAGKDNRFKELIDMYYGLKPVLTPTPFEAAAWSIIGQQINLNFAYTIKKRLVEKYGGKYRLDGKRYYTFPGPGNLARVRKETLRKMQFSERKAEYLAGFARAAADNPDFLEELNKISCDEAAARLIAVRGIGVWSANYILMRGIGHRDCLPLGDSGLSRAVGKYLNLGRSAENEEIERLADNYRPYRSLFTLYMWYSLMENISSTQ